MNYAYDRNSNTAKRALKIKEKTERKKRRFVDEYNVARENIYIDYKTGRKEKRPALNNLLMALKNDSDEKKIVYIAEVARLTREGRKVAFDLINKIKATGAIIIFINKNIDTSLEESMNIILNMADEAINAKNNRGDSIKYGYATKKRMQEESEKKKRGKPKSDEQINRAFEMYDRGYSVKEICNACDFASYKTLYNHLNKRKKREQKKIDTKNMS